MNGVPGQGKDLWHIFRLPLAIFLTTAAGLTIALLGDGWWHLVSWLLLAIPLAIIAAAWTRQTPAE